MSALYERFSAIQLNVLSWQCAWYYAEGAKDSCYSFIANESSTPHSI